MNAAMPSRPRNADDRDLCSSAHRRSAVVTFAREGTPRRTHIYLSYELLPRISRLAPPWQFDELSDVTVDDDSELTLFVSSATVSGDLQLGPEGQCYVKA